MSQETSTKVEVLRFTNGDIKLLSYDPTVFDNPETMVDKDGNYIPSRLRRRWDLLKETLIDPTQDELVSARKHAYEREVLLAENQAVTEAVSLRDGPNCSSAYLLGVQCYDETAFRSASDKLSSLKAWQVMVHPDVAQALGIVSGQIVQLWRHPIAPMVYDVQTPTKKPMLTVVEVVVSKRMDEWGVIGLPIGRIPWFSETFDVPEILGGDTDGEGYSILCFHTPELQAVNDILFERVWASRPELDQSDRVFTLEDETEIEEDHEGILKAKCTQKDGIGKVTVAALAAMCVCAMAGWKFRGVDSDPEAKDGRMVTMAELAEFMRLAIEAVMDMKNTVTADPGDCMKYARLLSGDLILSAEVLDAMDIQGFNREILMAIGSFMEKNSKTIRDLANMNPVFATLYGSIDETRQLHETMPDAGCAKWVTDVIRGRVVKRAAPKRSVGRNAFGALEKKGKWFKATMKPDKDEILVECGNVSHVIKTINRGMVIPLARNTKALWRPSLHGKFEGTRCGVVPLTNWAKFLEETAFVSHGYSVTEIRTCSDDEQAKELLKRLCDSIINGKPSKAYVEEDDSLDIWKVYAGMQRILVLDVPIRPVKDTDMLTLSGKRANTSAKWLKSKGLISRLCDTTSGKPGMEYLREIRKGSGRTVVTQFDPLAGLAPAKRSPYFSAMSGAEMLADGPNTDWILPECIRMPMPLRKAVVAVLPCGSTGTIPVRRGFFEQLAIMVHDLDASKECGYDLKMRFNGRSGMKIHSFIDGLKGLICPMPDGWMPWVKQADGTMRRADMVIALNSKSHHQVAHTIYSLALNAAAERLGGLPLEDYTVEKAVSTAIASGLYKEDCLTDIYAANGDFLGRYPGGIANVCVHSQIPSRIAKVHPRGVQRDDKVPTTFETGGFSPGLAGLYVMMSIPEMAPVVDEIWGNPLPALEKKLAALKAAIEYRPLETKRKN